MYFDNRLNPNIFAGESLAKKFDAGVEIPGVASSAAEAVAAYTAWAPALTAGVRRALGPRAVLVGNSAGALSDAALNGVTIEMEACVSRNCTDAVLGQKVARPP